MYNVDILGKFKNIGTKIKNIQNPGVYLFGWIILGSSEHIGSVYSLTAKLMHLNHISKSDQAYNRRVL